jgi:branched-chain amino acid transport system substrate-binding protein
MQTKLKLSMAAAAVGLFTATSAFAQDLVVKIGHVAPTSGQIAHLG